MGPKRFALIRKKMVMCLLVFDSDLLAKLNRKCKPKTSIVFLSCDLRHSLNVLAKKNVFANIIKFLVV